MSSYIVAGDYGQVIPITVNGVKGPLNLSGCEVKVLVEMRGKTIERTATITNVAAGEAEYIVKPDDDFWPVPGAYRIRPRVLRDGIPLRLTGGGITEVVVK